MNTQIGGWAFESHHSNVTISGSTLRNLWFYSCIPSTAYIYNSVVEDLEGYGFFTCNLCNTSIRAPSSNDESRFWLVNSTSNTYSVTTQSKVNICWYLDVQVTDAIGQMVPSANVTAFYHNATVCELKPTDDDGVARLMLMEKMN